MTLHTNLSLSGHKNISREHLLPTPSHTALRGGPETEKNRITDSCLQRWSKGLAQTFWKRSKKRNRILKIRRESTWEDVFQDTKKGLFKVTSNFQIKKTWTSWNRTLKIRMPELDKTWSGNARERKEGENHMTVLSKLKINCKQQRMALGLQKT